MTTLNERVERAMLLRGGLKPADLVRLTGISKSGISFILKGTTRAETIRATTIDLLARALSVNRDWLLYEIGPMEGSSPGPGVPVSYLRRLDPAIVQPAVVMARTLLATSGASFDPYGDVPLFISAYELMADATVENRARFDTALTSRVLATQGEDAIERDTTTPTGGGEKRGK